MIRITLEGFKPIDNREIYFKSSLVAIGFLFCVGLWPLRYYSICAEWLSVGDIRAECGF